MTVSWPCAGVLGHFKQRPSIPSRISAIMDHGTATLMGPRAGSYQLFYPSAVYRSPAVGFLPIPPSRTKYSIRYEVETVALRVLALFCVGAYHTKARDICRGEQHNRGIFCRFLPPTTNRLVKNVTSDDDQLDVQLATTSLAVSTAILTKLTPTAGSTLPTEVSVVHSDADTSLGTRMGTQSSRSYILMLTPFLGTKMGTQGSSVKRFATCRPLWTPLTRPSRASFVPPISSRVGAALGGRSGLVRMR